MSNKMPDSWSTHMHTFMSTPAEALPTDIAVIGMAVGVGLWTRLLQRRAGPRLALVTTAFLVTNPTLFRYGYSATNDGLAFALGSATMFTLLT